MRNWISSSILNGYSAEQLKQVLARMGFSPEEIERELAYAAPYVELATAFWTKISMREILLRALDNQMRAVPAYLRPEKIPLPSFNVFLEQYYYPNRAGLFSHVLEHCEARHWTPSYLLDTAGRNTIVDIQDAGGRGRQVTLGEFVESLASGNNFRLISDSYEHNSDVMQALAKDIQDIGGAGYLAHDTPQCRKLLQIEPEGMKSDVRFDIVNQLVIQVYGRRVLRLVPAMQVPYMYHDRLTLSDVDLLDPKPGVHPHFSKATVMEIVMEPGDCIFVPLGWWHHAVSLSTSIGLACANINIPGGAEAMVDSDAIRRYG